MSRQGGPNQVVFDAGPKDKRQRQLATCPVCACSTRLLHGIFVCNLKVCSMMTQRLASSLLYNVYLSPPSPAAMWFLFWKEYLVDICLHILCLPKNNSQEENPSSSLGPVGGNCRNGRVSFAFPWNPDLINLIWYVWTHPQLSAYLLNGNVCVHYKTSAGWQLADFQ